MTTTWWRKDRDPAMLFVDYNQNARDHTIASAYSVRGVPEATVSTPITWDEIDDVEPRECTIATVPGRFARLGDLHKGIDDDAYSLDTLLEWADRDGLTMVLGGSNTGVSIAMSTIAKEKKTPFFAIGAAGASLTGKDCTPYTMHYGYDTTALANGTATTILKQGGKSWFFVTADYAFGTQLQNAAASVVTAGGGKVVGAVRVPLNASDFSSYLLQAQDSGAQVLGLANAGGDFTNSLKAANEFGITKKMKPVALLAFLSDIHALGLETAQDLYLTTGWYWDLNDKTRAFAKRYFEKTQREPTMTQAAYYSATLAYLNAVKAVGSTDPDKVMAELHKTKVNDMFASNATIRTDGLLEHDMYVMQVKKPSESKYPWDYYRLVETMSGEQAFGKLSDSTCPLVKS